MKDASDEDRLLTLDFVVPDGVSRSCDIDGSGTEGYFVVVTLGQVLAARADGFSGEYTEGALCGWEACRIVVIGESCYYFFGLHSISESSALCISSAGGILSILHVRIKVIITSLTRRRRTSRCLCFRAMDLVRSWGC